MADNGAERLTGDRAELLRRRLQGRTAPAGGPGETPLTPRPTEERSVPSFGQRRLWFLDLLQPGHIGYTMPDIAYRLRGPLDVPALVAALRWIVDRHEVLRSRYGVTGGEPFVVVDDADSFQVDVAEVADIDEAREIARAEAEAPFDLAVGPLCRARVLRVGAEDHVLLVVFHHSVFDGWSIGVFQRELSVAYGAFAGGGVPGLGDLAVQYGDFAVWQREWLSGEVLEGQLGYWRDRLEGVAPALELPVDRVRPPVPSYRGGVVEFSVGGGLADGLRALGRREGASLFMVTLAVFQVLLGRYGRTEDVVTGCPSAGRSRPELEELIGFFVNSLPLRTDLSGDPSFVELVGRVRGVVLGAFDHQDVPFERLVEDLTPTRDLSRNPIIQVWFDLLSPGQDFRLDSGVSTEPFPSGLVTTRFDVELHLTETASGELIGELIYAADLFEAGTMRRFADHYQNLLKAVVAAPSAPLSRLQMAGPDELQEMLVEWNDTAVAVDDTRTLAGVFQDQAAATPEGLAVVWDGGSLTFGDLNAEANRLAWWLRGKGVGPETVVGVLLPRGPDQIVTILAILKAGGAYLPLDPAHPDDRIAFQLEDARAALTVTDQALAGRLPAGVEAVRADTDKDHWAGGPVGDPPEGHPDDLCYVIYTSGSTGRPKGVAMSHRPLLNLLHWQRARTTVPGPTLQFSSLNFDISVQEIFSTWQAGGHIVLLSNDQRRDPQQMIEIIARHRVRRLFCPPMVLEQLTHTQHQHDGQGHDRLELVEITTAGDRLHLNTEVRRFLEGLPAAGEGRLRLDNHYGPTEAHVITGHDMTGDPAHWPSDPPVGAPIANTRIYLLDPDLHPVPPGVPGEVCVGGAGLARGYLGRPDLTAAAFIPDPHATTPGARLYRTGDLARWNTDGTLDFLGRIDHQLKIRGYRIEPGEIHTTLLQHPAITDTHITTTQTPAGDVQLTAYIIPKPGQRPTTHELRAHLKQSLPDYMIPTHYITLDRFPLTPTGKLDRKALPEPASGSTGSTEVFVGDDAFTPTQRRLAHIWAQILNVPHLTVQDDFFDLGGHSLLATQVLARVHDEFGVTLAVRTLFEHPTVEDLAAHLDEQAGGADALPALVARAPEERTVPSFGQRRLWFLDQLQPGALAYSIPITYRLRGALDVAALSEGVSLEAWK